ncbi:MAG: response regulator [Holosporales bacterium]|jgi:two-component system response regulator|nr:response regulator [Holosporales bacterium]
MNDRSNSYGFYAQIGRKIRERRKKAGFTLEQASKIMRVTYQQIQKYENGQSRIPVEKLYEFSVLFNTPIQFFFEGAQKAPDSDTEELGIIHKCPDKHLNIFVIDDNPADEFLMRKAVGELDDKIKIFCVQNESNVINYLKKQDTCSGFPDPDLIFMDISISKCKYHLLISEIKKEKRIQEIPLIILTHSVRTEDLSKVYKSGAASFIRKSQDFVRFKNDMKACLEYWGRIVMLPSVAWRDDSPEGNEA